MRGAIAKYQKANRVTASKKTEKNKLEDVKVTLSKAVDEVEKVTVAPAAAADADDDFDVTDIQIPASRSTKEIPSNRGDILGSRDEIIREYAPLIKYIAQKIAARLPANIELDDLISAGVIGLMDAIDKYDPSRDNKFKTYAEFRVRGAILDELRAQDWVPRSVREKSKMLERIFVRYEQEKGRSPTDEEMCTELNCTMDEYHDLLNQVRSVSLLSFEDLNSFSKNDRRSALGLNEGGKSSTPFSEVNSANLKRLIAEAIRELPEKQRLVLSLYYYEDLNLKEIGRVLEVTESRVSQLHTQAVLRLKAKLKNNFDDFLALFNG